jgi:hypothetical protein
MARLLKVSWAGAMAPITMTRTTAPTSIEENALLERAKSFAREENIKVILIETDTNFVIFRYKTFSKQQVLQITSLALLPLQPLKLQPFYQVHFLTWLYSIEFILDQFFLN